MIPLQKIFLFITWVWLIFFNLRVFPQKNSTKIVESSPSNSVMSVQSPARLLVQSSINEKNFSSNENTQKTSDSLDKHEDSENTVFFTDTNTNPTIWQRYYRTTSTHPLRRADVLFFISIPFTLVWTDFWVQRFRDFSVIGAYFEGVRGSYNLRNSNFTYYHDTYPSAIGDPFYIFKWLNAVLWPLIIVTNDFLERISDPVKWEREKEEMIDNRFHLNLIYLPTH